MWLSSLCFTYISHINSHRNDPPNGPQIFSILSSPDIHQWILHWDTSLYSSKLITHLPSPLYTPQIFFTLSSTNILNLTNKRCPPPNPPQTMSTSSLVKIIHFILNIHPLHYLPHTLSTLSPKDIFQLNFQRHLVINTLSSLGILCYITNLQIFWFQPVQQKNLERLYNWVVNYNLLILVI